MIHPARKQVIIRWIVSLTIIFLGVCVIYLQIQQQLFAPPQETPALQKVELLTDNDLQTIEQAIHYLSKPMAASDIDLDQSLFLESSRKKALVLSGISMGRRTFAVINGQAYKVGEALDDGRTIVEITPEWVTLESKGRTERVLWSPPLQVELTKPEESDSGSTTATSPSRDNDSPTVDSQGLNTETMSTEEFISVIKTLGNRSTQ